MGAFISYGLIFLLLTHKNMLKFIIKDIKTIKEIYPDEQWGHDKMILCLENIKLKPSFAMRFALKIFMLVPFL